MTGPFTEQPENFSVNPKRSRGKLKLWLVGGGVLLLITIAIFSWWCVNNLIKDDIAELIPIDSVFYLTGRNSLLPWQTKVKDLPITNFFSEVDKPIDQSMRISYALVINQVNQLEPIYFFKSDRFIDFKHNDFNFEHSAKIGKILVVAKSGEVLNRIIEVKENKTFSLATVMNNKSYNQINFYLSSRNFREYLKQFSELHYQLLGKIIDQDVYGEMSKKNDHWIFDVDSNIKNINTTSQLDSLPIDFKIFMSGLSLVEVFESWGTTDQTIIQTFTQVTNSLGAIYDFDVVASVNNLIKQPADLILFDKITDDIFDFDYVLVFNSVTEPQALGLKKLINVILAQKFPREVIRVLPDASTVTELQASPGDWEWQTKTINQDLIVSYLVEPRINFNFAYLIKDNQLFISNSIQRLEQFSDGEQISLIDLAVCGVDPKQGSTIVLNRGQKLFDYSIDNYVVMNQSGERGVQGCFGGN